MFQQSMIAGWGDMDFNAHMRNTAYLDRSADARMLYFASRGFRAGEFARLGVGPVVRRDELSYFREIGLLEQFTVTLAAEGMSADGSHWMLRNEFIRADGETAATVRSIGGWLDASARKLVVPPSALLDAMSALGRTADFVELTSSIR
jgi:acyl-CoA thioester hydrolase